MEFGDLCPWCLEADCPSTAQTCPGLAKPAAEAPPTPLFDTPGAPNLHAGFVLCTDDNCPCSGSLSGTRHAHAPSGRTQWLRDPPAVALCGFCFGAGGYRVPCHGCKVVGPVMVAR